MRCLIVHAEALTCLGHGDAMWDALAAGRSGLRSAALAFPGTEGLDMGGHVGVIPGVVGPERVPQILDQAFASIVPAFFYQADLIVGACSVGDLTGEDAGNPYRAMQRQINKVWPRDSQVPPMHLVSSACSSGTDALIMGAQAVDAGLADIVAVLAFDSLDSGKLIQHIALGTQSPERARPFDAARSGTSFGEACAVVVLVSAAGLERLAVPAFGRIVGFGMSSDAYDIAAPEPHGTFAAGAIRAALAKVPASAVGYINAHGSATPLNDAAESRALHLAFGEQVEQVCVGSTKGALGHSLGATGLVEAVVTLHALRRNCYPPTAGLHKLDPALGINVLQELQESDDARPYAMSVTFGFGGVNSAVLLEAT